MNHEDLMMDALDGAIGATDRQKLEVYLTQHPAERAAFKQMMAVDMALREAPISAPPSDFSQAVISRARGVPIARPWKRRHLALFVATNSVLASFVWVFGCAVLVVLGALLLQQPIFQLIVAFARSINTYAVDAFGVLASIIRSLISQPILWATALIGASVVVAWLSVMAKVLMPARALAPATMQP